MISFSLIIVQILSSMWIKLKIKSERWYIKMKSNHQLRSLTTIINVGPLLTEFPVDQMAFGQS